MEQKKEMREVYRTFELSLEQANTVSQAYDLGTISTIKRFDDGMVNDVFSLDEKYVLKINPPHADMPKLAKEYKIYKTLPKYGIPGPQPFVLDENKTLLPYPFIVMEQLQGMTLGSNWASLTEEQKKNYLLDLGEMLGKIHNLGTDAISLPGESGIPFWEEFERRIIEIADKLQTSEVFLAETIARIKNFYLQSDLFVGDIKNSLIHGNYNFNNTLVSNGTIQGIIDWEWSRFGHSEEELATFLQRFLKNDHDRELFKEGYLRSRTISAQFESRITPYVLLYYLGIMPDVHNWTHRPDKQKEYKDATDSLMKQLELLD